VITSGELFQRGELRRVPRRRLGKAIDSFLDLRQGDLVVHLAHGIGRYRGMQLLDKDGRVEEHLQIEFAGGTRIYVPATRIGLVQKYVGGTKTRPVLAKIGNKTWVRQKQAAESAVIDLAAELLELQAERRARPGIAFAVESDWQREFDASFPYQETPDQLLAIAAIQKDMSLARPMDRLLCGDVGFGKTELAMRAAFKAVDNGYQVALLAPTTVLVEQHYHTFRQRMAEFPFDIARLSRFCSAREQREITRRLAAGQIDIVIGTHRLASQDVRFRNSRRHTQIRTVLVDDPKFSAAGFGQLFDPRPTGVSENEEPIFQINLCDLPDCGFDLQGFACQHPLDGLRQRSETVGQFGAVLLQFIGMDDPR